jgi:pimeloyl-ACP methyl ester carboxylesterase
MPFRLYGRQSPRRFGGAAPLAAIVAVLTGLLLAPLAQAEVVNLKTRDTTIRLLIEGPVRSAHVVVLFSGGRGDVEIADDGTIGLRADDFAVRTRNILQAAGMATVVVASPADMGKKLMDRRNSTEYATDFGNVIAYLRGRFKAPVWAHGTSQGSIGVLFPVSKISDPLRRPDGIISSSSVTLPLREYKLTVLDAKLDAITGPVLLIAHDRDSCKRSPPAGAKRLANELKQAKPVRVLMISGHNENAKGHSCAVTSQHGFPGMDQEVGEAMVQFIKAPH